jgi:hypothetical protein
MTLKYNKHKDYLLWIYPIILLGLIIFLIKRDESSSKSSWMHDISYNLDSLIIISPQTITDDGSKAKEHNDNTSTLNVILAK